MRADLTVDAGPATLRIVVTLPREAGALRLQMAPEFLEAVDRFRHEVAALIVPVDAETLAGLPAQVREQMFPGMEVQG